MIIIGAKPIPPQTAAAAVDYSKWSSMRVGADTSPDSWPCNCIGPQAGQAKCPCALRVEAKRGDEMVRDGVMVNGKRYKLVETPPHA